MSQVVMLKKMTAKTVLGTKVKAPEAPEKLYTIYGVANGVKKGESQFGPWTMLTGNFEAVHDGKRYVSTVCALPQPMHDLIIDAVLKGTGDVQYACDVMLHPADNAYGYEYFANPLVEQSENDPLAALREKVGMLALDAPAETAEAEKPAKAKGK